MRTMRFQVLIVLASTSIAGGFIGACSKGGDNPSAPQPPPPPPVGASFDSGNPGQLDQFSYTFAGADTVGYHCKHHGMPATVRVHAGAPGLSASVGIQSSPRRFSPQIVEVQPGGTVTWTNGTSDAHTVTSN